MNSYTSKWKALTASYLDPGWEFTISLGARLVINLKDDVTIFSSIKTVSEPFIIDTNN